MDDKTIQDALAARNELEDVLHSLAERGIHSPGLQKQLEQAIEAVWEVELSKTQDDKASPGTVVPAAAERRQFPREPVGGSGTLVFADGLTRLDVLVVNISRTGIMLELPEAVDLPSTFTLLFRNVLEPCELVWQNGLFAGVRYSA